MKYIWLEIVFCVFSVFSVLEVEFVIFCFVVMVIYYLVDWLMWGICECERFVIVIDLGFYFKE